MKRRNPALITLGLAASLQLAACGESAVPPDTQAPTAVEASAPHAQPADTDRAGAGEPAAPVQAGTAQPAAPQSAYQAALDACNDLRSQRGKDKCRAAAKDKYEGEGEADDAGSGAANEASQGTAVERGAPKE